MRNIIMWKNIEAAPADAILGLTEAFKNDDNTQKVNLGVGVYKDEQGNTPILSCIKTAENMLLEDQITKGYLPIPGTAEYGLKFKAYYLALIAMLYLQRELQQFSPQEEREDYVSEQI